MENLAARKAGSGGTIKLLEDILSRAIELRASDIHLEPNARGIKVRYRVDGLLTDDLQIHRLEQPALISRVKILANLNIAESRLPQDGRGRHEHIDLRVSVIPTLAGEKATIRLLDQESHKLNLADLGMAEEESKLYRSMAAKKTGIILVTGPTGSGKTSTLYATLKELQKPEVNIITIEDPVEYQLAGINQIQVNPKIGLTFANGLRAILRQDPDIILVGEIRDPDTAKVAVQASLTGHLVLATLHANDCLSAPIRLIDMGIEPYLIGATLIGVVAQRLARKPGGKGRNGIFEILPMNEELRELISRNAGLSVLREKAIASGFLPLAEKLPQLVAAGITTAAEFWRVW